MAVVSAEVAGRHYLFNVLEDVEPLDLVAVKVAVSALRRDGYVRAVGLVSKVYATPPAHYEPSNQDDAYVIRTTTEGK